MIRELTAASAWIQLVRHIITHGTSVSPRGQKVIEVLGVQTAFDMKWPVVNVAERMDKIECYRFMAAEAFWILTGSDKVDGIAPYAPSISQFSDNGHSFFGAYGPKIRAQIDYVVNMLAEDRDTRQAVINIWRENPPKSKDIPCTLSVQFFIRGGMIHCVDTMRSSDVWLGWVYDVFNFSCLSALIALELRERGISLELGTLYFTAGSQHLYDRNYERACACVNPARVVLLAPLIIGEFESPTAFMGHLDAARQGKPLGKQWLQEVQT